MKRAALTLALAGSLAACVSAPPAPPPTAEACPPVPARPALSRITPAQAERIPWPIYRKLAHRQAERRRYTGLLETLLNGLCGKGGR